MSKKKNKQNNNQPQNHFSLRTIKPLTPNQQETFDSFAEGKHLLLHGVAGTGKTFISLYLALNEILNRGKYSKTLIIRSAVASRDIGFLPGNLKEKTRIYEDPYKTICDDLFARGDGYDILKMKTVPSPLDMEENFADGKRPAYKTPNLDYEWKEAQRYPIFAKLGLEGWKKLQGKQVNVKQLGGLQKIGNHTAPDQNTAKKEIQNLEQDKVKRMQAMIQSGQVELPIVVKLPNGKIDLLGGNTRFTGLVANGISPDVWYIDASNLEENFADGKGPGRPGDSKRNILTFGSILDKMSCFTKIEFGVEDIVRSNFVKSYIISKLECGYV